LATATGTESVPGFAALGWRRSANRGGFAPVRAEAAWSWTAKRRARLTCPFGASRAPQIQMGALGSSPPKRADGPNWFRTSAWHGPVQISEAKCGGGRVVRRGYTENTARDGIVIADNYDFSNIGTLTDVGGGQGLLIASVLRANPHLRGVLFDLPKVIARVHRCSKEWVCSTGARSSDAVTGEPTLRRQTDNRSPLAAAVHPWDTEVMDGAGPVSEVAAEPTMQIRPRRRTEIGSHRRDDHRHPAAVRDVVPRSEARRLAPGPTLRRSAS
jgi:O-methyltransferase domain